MSNSIPQKTKHTTGEWLVRPLPPKDTFSEHGGAAFTIGTAGGFHIASIHQQGTDTEANARLIASAPDMLEALKECVAEWDTKWENPPEGHGTPQEPPSVMFARQAIAKAEGGK